MSNFKGNDLLERIGQESRNTGRTYRICLKALLHSSEGFSVIILVNNESMAESTKRRLLEMLYPGMGSFIASVSRNRITFKNKAWIELVAKRNYGRNLEQKAIIFNDCYI